MTPQDFVRLFKQYAFWFILIPTVTASTVFYFTKHEVKLYKSQATLYTGLASGYSLLSIQQNSFGDRSEVAFNNLLTTLSSTETLRQIGVNLLTRHLQLQKSNGLILSEQGFFKLQEAIPVSLRHSLVEGHTPDQLYQKVDSLSQAETSNPIKTLLLQSDSYYSVAQINDKLKTVRKNTNDMLVMEYESDDPAVSQQTLRYAIEILSKRYTLLKTTETNSVVNYYNAKSQHAQQRLKEAEDKLKTFSVGHRVLDFNEESRNIATSKEAVINEYNQEMMRNEAAKASVSTLAQRMGNRANVLSASTELKAKQDELIDAQNRLANARAYSKDKNLIVQQQAVVDQITASLKATALKYYATNNAADAIPQQTLINDWLAKVLEHEESSARLKLYTDRLREYETKTTEFTPLSSQLRQLNRELTTAEKEYEVSADNLNKATTQHQNFTVDGSLTVLDTPSFPLSPLPSKRLLFIGAAVAVGLFLALILVGLRFWLDRRIDSPEKAELIIGRPVAAMFPTVRSFLKVSKAGQNAMSMFEQLCNAINIEIIQAVAKPQPPIVTLFSVRSGQGKSWIGNGLTHLYAEAGQQIAYFYPRFTANEQLVEQKGITFIPYTLRPDFMNVLKLEQLLHEDEAFVAARYDKVILELPPLLSSPIPIYLVDQSYLSVLVIDVNNPWGRTEKQQLQMYMRIAKHPVLTVLNRVKGDYMDILQPTDITYRLKRYESFLTNDRELPTGV